MCIRDSTHTHTDTDTGGAESQLVLYEATSKVGGRRASKCMLGRSLGNGETNLTGRGTENANPTLRLDTRQVDVMSEAEIGEMDG